MTYPLLNVYITNWKITIFNGTTHYKWQFSIAFCTFTRGYLETVTFHMWNSPWDYPKEEVWGSLATRSSPFLISMTGLKIAIWLVVSTHLKNISQLGWLFPIYGKNVPNHQPAMYFTQLLSVFGMNIRVHIRTCGPPKKRRSRCSLSIM